MTIYNSLSHSKWECKYHLIFVPKCRREVLYGKTRVFLQKSLPELARQKGCEIIGGHVLVDHVHIIISVPPKHAVSSVVGFLKGKSAISIARQFGGKQRNFNGENFWARGYAISTVGFELEAVKEYVLNQRQLDGQYSDSGSF